MSKSGEKADCASRRVVVGLLALFSALAARASVDQPDVATFSANGWHGSGWLTHGVQQNVESGKPILDNVRDMVFSPHYAQPIRKVVLETRCTTSSSPTRFLTVCPYVAGTEDASRQVKFEVVENWGNLTILSADFASEDAIDAIRIGMTDSGTGNWILTRLAVICGEKTPDEDEILRTFARQLPTPENLVLTGLTSSSLTLSATAVEGAVGYCFELTKLTGTPRTEIREDFISAPNLSNGWTFDVESEGFKLSDGGKFYFEATAGDEHALKIERGTSTKELPVELGLISPLCPESLAEWSFVARIGSTEKSNRFAIFGRTSAETGEWIELAKELTPDTTGSTRFAGKIDSELDIRQVRFVLTASANSWTTTGLDSLCVVYGGNEVRELISTQTNTTPEAAWQDLASGRYSYRVKALGETEGEKQFKDSAWSEEQIVDLAWVGVRLSPPENLAFEVSGDKLNLSWTPVVMADRYEVKVALVDDPENPVATLVTKSASASVPIAELGAYVVTVTAVSPGGVSRESTSLENCAVALGKVTGLEVVATAADTIAATWKAVPLAESYQAKLFKVTGEARTEVASIGTKDCAATYRGLDRTAKYVVVVTPQPSEGTECEASSVVVDLASEYFRTVSPVSVASCKGGVYLERFDALACVTKETDIRRVPLENWQFFKGSDEAEKLFYTSGTNSTRGGVYCYSDAERTTNSFMIGTVATSTMGSSVGLAFVNDTGSSLDAPTLTFTAVRRNEKPGEPYVLEWLVTDGPWSIGTESDAWQPLQVAEGEPEFSVTPDCRLGPGQVIIFRWRHEKVKGGPMLGLDDVYVAFPVVPPGFGVYVR